MPSQQTLSVALGHLVSALQQVQVAFEELENAPPPPGAVTGPRWGRSLPYDDAAAYLGVSVRTMKQLAKVGEVPKLMIGSRVLFAREDLDAYVDRLKAAR